MRLTLSKIRASPRWIPDEPKVMHKAPLLQLEKLLIPSKAPLMD